MTKEKAKIRKGTGSDSLLVAAISIIVGVLLGSVVLLVAGYSPADAWGKVVMGSFSQPKYVGYLIIYATPLILTGLSVAFAFRTGLFNIGVEGQFIIGALAATVVGRLVPLPPLIHPLFIMLVAMLAASLWGAFAGFLKAAFGINEVITTIMLNWIALYFNNFVVNLDFIKSPDGAKTLPILPTATMKILGEWKTSLEGKAWLKDNPFFQSLLDTPVNWGILFAVLAALAFWFILKRTTLGYELRAVGFNKMAAEYGGINVKKGMIVAMAISGALAGLSGAVHVMGNTSYVTQLSTMEGFGFDGIAVSLIGNNGPLGCVVAGLLFGFLRYGGGKLQLSSNALGIPAPTEIVNIVIGIIIFFVAMPKLVKLMRESSGGFLGRILASGKGKDHA